MQNSPKFDKDREFENHVEEPSLPQPPQGWGNVCLVIMVASLITLKKKKSTVSVCVCVCVHVCSALFFSFSFLIILYVNCFGRTMLYMCIEYHI